MKTRICSFFYLLISILFFSCNTPTEIKKEIGTLQSVSLSYAQRFAIKKTSDYTVLELFGNRDDKKVTATFVLYKNQKPDYDPSAYYIKTPVSKIVSMSSIYTTMLEQLQALDKVAAIDNVDYYNNVKIQKSVNEHKVQELSKGPKIDIERVLALNPDLILTFGMGNPKSDVDEKLLQANLPVAISLDHLEETPLARFEWIKFVACFVGQEKKADSLFMEVEKRYTALKQLTVNVSKKPTVFTEMKYGEVWYVPAGNSYMAHLIADAGGDYIWKENKNEGSTPLSFEMVYAKAKEGDYWINTYNMNSKKELISHDERYGLFKAYKENHIFNNNKIQNSRGFSNYWEDGISKPDEVLADLISIFYPEILPGHTLTFYKQIE